MTTQAEAFYAVMEADIDYTPEKRAEFWQRFDAAIPARPISGTYTYLFPDGSSLTYGFDADDVRPTFTPARSAP